MLLVNVGGPDSFFSPDRRLVLVELGNSGLGYSPPRAKEVSLALPGSTQNFF